MIDAFHRRLHERISEQVLSNSMALGAGSALSYDEYKRQVGYIHALNDVIEWAAAIEEEMFGTKRQEDL